MLCKLSNYIMKLYVLALNMQVNRMFNCDGTLSSKDKYDITVWNIV